MFVCCAQALHVENILSYFESLPVRPPGVEILRIAGLVQGFQFDEYWIKISSHLERKVFHKFLYL